MATLAEQEYHHNCTTCGQSAVERAIKIKTAGGGVRQFIYRSHTFCTTCDEDIIRQRQVSAAAHRTAELEAEFRKLPEEEKWLEYGMITTVDLLLETPSACLEPCYIKAFVEIVVAGLRWEFTGEPHELTNWDWAAELAAIKQTANPIAIQLKERADRGLPTIGR